MEIHVLADGLGGLLLVSCTILGLACTAAAIVVEAVLLKWLWNRRFLQLLGLSFLANLISGLIGVWPLLTRQLTSEFVLEADPWVIYQTYWKTFFVHVMVLFVLTYVIELGVYALANGLSKKRISGSRLLGGAFLGNVCSYVLLLLVIWWMPPRVNEFDFRPDASWVNVGTKRVWFFDPDIGALCSIGLNGDDRRIELAKGAGRFPWYVDELSVYALLPEQNAIIYLDEKLRWHYVHEGRDELLPAPDLEQVYPMREVLWDTLQEVLMHLPDGEGKGRKPSTIYFMWTERPWRIHTRTTNYEAAASMLWTIGLERDSLRITTAGGEYVRFGIKAGVFKLPCADPVILNDEGLVLFRCGSWIMVMDPAARRVGRLVKGDSMVLEVPEFGPLPAD